MLVHTTREVASCQFKAAILLLSASQPHHREPWSNLKKEGKENERGKKREVPSGEVIKKNDRKRKKSRRKHTELAAAQRRRIPCLSMPKWQLLALLQNTQCLMAKPL